jgi:8-oxo-dGTP pyrophosphatase MutT (NUDIX family)
LPGGRCELLESSKDTLVREFMEEAGATVHVQRLLWVIENFYKAHGETFHELGLYYLTESDDINPEEEFEGGEINGNTLYFRWFDIDKLDEIEILPGVLHEALAGMNNGIQHFVSNELE